jgi:2-oxopent-4-enoate/cis-2-oxohex-4-enoate hydratase
VTLVAAGEPVVLNLKIKGYLMDASTIQQCGDALYQALLTRKTVVPLTTQHPDITVDDAYHIQLRMIEQRLKATG